MQLLIDLNEMINASKCPCSEFSGPHFPAFGLDPERYGVSLRVQSKSGNYGPEKLRIRTLHTGDGAVH